MQSLHKALRPTGQESANHWLSSRLLFMVTLGILLALVGCGEQSPPNDEALDVYLAYLDEHPEVKPPADLPQAAVEHLHLYPEHQENYFAGMDVAYEPPKHPHLVNGILPLETENGAPATPEEVRQLLKEDQELRRIELTPDEWRGRNTWMMWTGGNAAFWDYLARESNGLVDLLRLLDARHLARPDRFRVLGLVPEPCMQQEDGSQAEKHHGLWLDHPSNEYDAYKNERGTPDPTVYGYSSGIVGLRLFDNPNFDAAARERWDPERFIHDENYYKDPELVRPYRVGMACAFCHASYNPLRPPVDPANPRWENLASNVGNQYFRVGGIFGYDMRESNIIRQLLNSSRPGTIDTSLVATDGSNNPNTMNAVYGVLERIAVSLLAETGAEEVAPATYEHIGTLNGLELGRLVPKVNEAATNTPSPNSDETEQVTGVILRLGSSAREIRELKNLFDVDSNGVVRLVLPDKADRRVPHILAVGEDSVGALAALCRVYLNIGEFHQEWIRNHNLMYGLNAQSPFRLSVAQEHSASWRASELRAVNLAKFFLKVSTPKRLEDADGVQPVVQGGKVTAYEITPADSAPSRPVIDLEKAKAGAQVFAQECFVCHSSKQPDEFWQDPANYERWRHDEDYLAQAKKLVADATFRDGNYYSTDARYPISLIGTNAGRSLADNALPGRVWEDFSSITYKQFRQDRAVNSVFVQHPYEDRGYTWRIPRNFEAEAADPTRTRLWGPGYYRAPSLISIWATAPFLHNNSLGDFPAGHDPLLHQEPDVSVAGRLAVFDDAARKLLWPEERHNTIHRTTVDSSLQVPFPVLRGAFARLTGYEPIILFHNNPWVLSGVLTALGLAIFFWGRERPRVAFRLAGLTLLFLVGLIVFEIWWGRNAETNGAIEAWGSATPIATWARLAILMFAAVGFWRAANRPRRIFQLAGALTVLYACTLFASAWLLAVFLLLLGLGLFVQLIDFRYALRALGVGILVIGGYVLLRDWELHELFYFPLLAVGVIAIGFVLIFTSKHPELTLRIVGRALIVLAIAAFFVGQHLRRDGLSIGHIPAGTPINLVANINSPGLYEDPDRLQTLAEVFVDLARVSNRRLPTLNHPDVPNLVPNLLKINKCPDLVLDRGHTFGSQLSDDEKHSLIEYLKTL